ncbi:MAG: hypothetical protein ACI4M9_00415 [Succinivibrio sp.]
MSVAGANSASVQDSELEGLKGKTLDKNSPSARKLFSIISSIFSRCGVPVADIEMSDTVAFDATVSTTFSWSFKCRCTDKIIKNITEGHKIMSIQALDQFTLTNSRELEKDSAKTKEFIKMLSHSSYREQEDLAGQIVCFNRISALGRTKCKACHGAGSLKCENCGGTGQASCPNCKGHDHSCNICHGSGKVRCATCSGTGRTKCRECEGKGEQIVEREIIYDAVCLRTSAISLHVPGTEKAITSFNLDDEKTLKDAAVFSDENHGVESDRGFRAVYNGSIKCYAVTVHLKNVKNSFSFILCGESLKPVCKPNVIDYTFAQEAQVLSDTLITAPDDVEEKIKCVKALSSKAILARTIRAIEGIEIEIAKKEAVAQGVTLEAILNSRVGKDNPKASALRSKVRNDVLDSVAEELKQNAYGYISDEFARSFARNLISFVPMLMNINPHTKIIWAGVTLFAWLVMLIFMYALPSVAGCIIGLIVTSSICVFTSIGLTKNWAYYSAVSMLRLTHHMKKVPNVATEAVNSAKLLAGSLIIGIVAIVLKTNNWL